MAINQVPNHVCNILIYQDNIYVSSLYEVFEAVFNLRDAGVLIHNLEVWLPLLVDLAYASEEEPDAGVLRIVYSVHYAGTRMTTDSGVFGCEAVWRSRKLKKKS